MRNGLLIFILFFSDVILLQKLKYEFLSKKKTIIDY